MKVLPVFVLLFFVVSLQAQDYEVSITTIQVWVKALDRNGNPVEGLTASDFEVFEGEKRVNTTCFEEVKHDVPLVSVRPAEPNVPATIPETAGPSGPSRIVLFVDLLNTSQAEYLTLRERTEEFFNSVKERGIPVMLVALTPTGRLGVLERFTTDIDRIRTRFGKLQANSQRDTRMSNARREISRILSRSPDLSPAVKAAENVANVAQRQDEREAEAMLNALQGFQSYWAQNYSEHAVVLYASGGVNAEPGRQYYDMIANFRPDMAFNGGLEIPTQSQDIRTQLKKLISQVNRSNLTFYTINTRGTVNIVDNIYESNIGLVSNTNYLHDYQEFQDVLADETGGLSFRNSFNFGDALQTMLTDISHYYLICYSPPFHKERNRYHKIKVRAKRADVHVRHRAGYLD